MANMTYQQLGTSGLTVSTVGLGCNNFGARMADEEVQGVVDAAIDSGITFFDTADRYSAGRSEELLGKALGKRREQVIVATKFGLDVRGINGPEWGARASRRYIRQSIEASLRRLGTDWIDLYQLHTPDPHTPIAETLSTLNDLVTEGKVRYIGSSNFKGWQMIDADWTAQANGFEPFISEQNEYSWLRRGIETDLIPALAHTGVGLLPFFPLASGLLTGKYHRGQAAPPGSRLANTPGRFDGTETDFDVIDRLRAFAAEHDITLLQIALGGLAAMPMVSSVIAGATSPAQVRQNVAAGLWVPSEGDLTAIMELTA